MSIVMQMRDGQIPEAQDPQQAQPAIPAEGVRANIALPSFELPDEFARDGLDSVSATILEETSSSNEHQEDCRLVNQVSEEILPFPTLPRELNLHIFSFLNTHHLQQAALVSRQSRSLSVEIRKRQFLKKFSASHWWKFLVALADNIPGEGNNKFVDVLILGMGAGTRIPAGWREENDTLSAYITRRMTWFPDKIQHLGFGVSGYEDIQKKAQTLLALMCPENDRTQFNGCTTLNDCMALVGSTNKITAFQEYHDLDRLFSCLILFELMSTQQANNRLNFLIQTPFSRGLTGEGLITLECQFQGIFPALVREAIRLFQIDVKAEADKNRLKVIEKLLGRLTEADILRYVDTETEKPPFLLGIPLQRQIFIEVLRSNYDFLIAKMTFAVLIRVEGTVLDRTCFKSLLIPHVIQSRFILSRLKSNELLSLLKILREAEVAEIIENHSLLQPLCTVDIMEELLKNKTGRSGLVRVFLSNKILLDKLSDDHIVAFNKQLSMLDFEAVIGSESLRARMRAASNNELLMRLAKANQIYTIDYKPMKNLDIFDVLTAYQAVELFDYKKIHFHDVLFNSITLMDKLSSTQLIHVLREYDPKSCLTLIQGRLHKFTTEDLLLLVKSLVSEKKPTDISTYLLEALPAEIDRRVSLKMGDDFRVDSKALCALSCTHPQLGCYILDHHVDSLATDEYLSIKKHYPLTPYDSNSPILIAIQKAYSRQSEIVDRNLLIRRAKRYQSSARSPSTQQLGNSPLSYQVVREDPDEPKSPQETSLMNEDEWSWIYFILQLICIIGAVFGLLLTISGIGSALGISMIVSATQFLFAALPSGQALAVGVLGLSIFVVSSVGWFITDEAKQNALTSKNYASDLQLSNKADDQAISKFDITKISQQHKNPVPTVTNSGSNTRDSMIGSSEDEVLINEQSILKM